MSDQSFTAKHMLIWSTQGDFTLVTFYYAPNLVRAADPASQVHEAHLKYYHLHSNCNFASYVKCSDLTNATEHILLMQQQLLLH